MGDDTSRPSLTAQHRGVAVRGIKRRGAAPPQHRVRSVSALIDIDTVVVTLDDGSTRAIEMTYNGQPTPGHYRFAAGAAAKSSGAGFVSSPPIPGIANPHGFVIAWTVPDDVTFAGVARYDVYVVSGRTHDGAGRGVGPGGQGLGNALDRPDSSQLALPTEADPTGDAVTTSATGLEPTGADRRGTDVRGTGAVLGPGDQGAGGKVGAGDDPMVDDSSSIRLSKRDEAVWRELARLAVPRGEPPVDPSELIRQYRVLLRAVDRPIFGDSGEPWFRVVELLDRNRGRFEGKLTATKGVGFTAAALQAVLDHHEKLVAPEPVEAVSADEEVDLAKQLRYEPGWAVLLPSERTMLVEYARRTGRTLRDEPLDYRSLNTTVKVCMALVLTIDEWPAEIADHAIAAFTDWKYVVTTVAILMTFFVLWNTPHPAAQVVTKLLTAYLLYSFAKEDVLAFIVAIRRFVADCADATNIDHLIRGGKRFATTVGQVGFDIIMMILVWRIGKRVNPKLRRYGAQRSLARAEAKLAEVRAQAGVGEIPASDASATLLETAKAAAGEGATPGQILDELAARLTTDTAKNALKNRRGPGDRNAAGVLEGMEKHAATGKPILKVVGLAKPGALVRASTDARVTAAEAKVVRAKVNLREIDNPAYSHELARRKTAAMLAKLEKLGILRRVAARLKLRLGVETIEPADLIAKLGEAISAREMELKYPAVEGYEVHQNVQLVRELKDVTSKREWIDAADTQPERRRRRGAVRQHEGRIWESVTDIDTLVVRRAADGRWTAVAMEQVKTGRGSPGEAHAQNRKAYGALSALAAGDTSVAVFLPDGKTGFGSNIAAQFDPSGLAKVRQSTRGPSGEKAFDESLYGLTAENFKEVAAELIRHRNMPEPQGLAPTSPKDYELLPEGAEPGRTP